MRFLRLPTLLLLTLALLFVIPSAVEFYADWLWFDELGYETVFLRRFNTEALIFVSAMGVAFAFLFVNLQVAGRSVRGPQIVLGTDADGRTISFESRRLPALAVPVALVVALVLAISTAGHWLRWLSYWHATPFGDADPLYGRDVAFYVFTWPVLQAVRQQAVVLSLITLVGCGLFYLLSGSFVIDARQRVAGWPRIRLMTPARRHLGLLIAIVLGLMAWGAWLDIARTLLTPAPGIVGFGVSYVDWHARIPFLWVGVVTLATAAGLALGYGFGRRTWPLVVALVLFFGVSTIGGVYSGILQRFVVTPNEQVKEQPFIVNNIAATRRAYALDRVEERELSGDAELLPQDIITNAPTIENVRLWDHQPLLQTFAQIQEIRTYYDFISVDNDRYTLDGKYRQVMLSARELNTESMANRVWTSERLTFTHGYGLTLGPVNEVTSEGLPVLFVKDLPPVSTVNLRIDEPSIYYGELSSNYVIVRTKQEEFHYPRGDDNETTYYEGSGGVAIGSLGRRLLFALRFGSTDILFSGQITRESRIMFHRAIKDRVRRLAPFLSYDGDPYPVVADGRIFWVQDAYTTTPHYPYATPAPRAFGAFNYMRNSVKVTVDAYHGTTTFYLAEPDEPIARTFARIFPTMFRPLAEMPEALRHHVRYPEDIFKVQTSIYSTYHMTNPKVFFTKEDQWQIPVLESEQNAMPMQPYYTMMRLPGERQTEFIQMLPFTPRAKDNLAAWMVARSDADKYGRLLVFQFPKQKIVYGPRQIVGRINQDQIISPQITLWNQQGSEVIWGTLLVIPIDESLLYVRPLYLRSPQAKIPELKRVIVAYQSRIVMAESLRLALSQIFGGAVAAALAPDLREGVETAAAVEAPKGARAAAAPAAALTIEQLAAEASAHYQRMAKAQRDGDWALYGEELKKLGEVLERMRAKR
jgi:hypothetical protein